MYVIKHNIYTHMYMYICVCVYKIMNQKLLRLYFNRIHNVSSHCLITPAVFFSSRISTNVKQCESLSGDDMLTRSKLHCCGSEIGEKCIPLIWI